MRGWPGLIIGAALLAAAMTAFYYWRETFSGNVRMATTPLLAPLAVAAKLEGVLGLGNVYQSRTLIFAANFVAALILVTLIHWAAGRLDK